MDTLDGIVGRAARPIVTERIDTTLEPDAVLHVLADQQHATRFPVRLVVAPTVTYFREHTSSRDGGARLQISAHPRGGSTVVLSLPVPVDKAADDVAAVAQSELRRLVTLAGDR